MVGSDIDKRLEKRRKKQGEREDFEPEALDGLLSTLLARSGYGGRLAALQPEVRAAFDRAIGESLASRCELLGIEEGVARVRVRDAAWRYDLQFRRMQLLEALRREMPMLSVREIRLVS